MRKRGIRVFSLLFAAATIVLGAALVATPWIFHFQHDHLRATVFILAGSVEILLGGVLARLGLGEGALGAGVPRGAGSSGAPEACTTATDKHGASPPRAA